MHPVLAEPWLIAGVLLIAAAFFGASRRTQLSRFTAVLGWVILFGSAF